MTASGVVAMGARSIGRRAPSSKRPYIPDAMNGSPTPPPLEDVQRAVGTRYTVEALAGTGGMGAVYRARHRELGHEVAIKVLPPEVAHSTMRQARFKREAALAARLSHPHIVPVYEFETREGLSFLIMPFVAGRTLEAVLETRDRPAPGDVLRVVREIGAALDFAHARGVVHRDVKPSNILIEEGTARALLTDFGVAQADPSQGGGSLTAPGAPIGTPDYMAPEQVSAENVDGRADLYALAVVVFEALTGTLPGTHVERGTLARALAAAQPALSGALSRALVAPLATLPADRPATAEAWLRSIQEARRGRRRVAVALGTVALLAAALGGRALCRAGVVCRPVPTGRAIAVMPFAVIGTSPFSSSTQLAEVFVSRFAPVDEYDGVVSLGKVLTRSGPRAVGQSEADTIARDLGARYFVLGDATFGGDSLHLTARLYEVGRRAPSGTAAVTASLGATSDALDRAWGQLLGSSFAPSRYGTLPQGKDALVAYLDAERAFRDGGYGRAAAAYDRVIALDSTFSLARFRRALVIAQVDPTGDSVDAALRGALRHQSGLSPADSLMLDGYAELLERGDGGAALTSFRAATRVAPDQPLAWFVLGEFHAHFGALYGQSADSAVEAFNRSLDLVPQYAPAIAHLISFAYLRGDRAETRRLMDQYRKLDSASVVAQVIGIADTLIFGSPAAKLAVVGREGSGNGALERRPFEVLAFLATQAAAFGSDADRQGPGRRVLRALQARAATPAERERALRMGVAADLRYGWLDSARARLAAAPSDAQAERDRWMLLPRAAGLDPLGTPAAVAAAASRLASRSLAAGDPVSHWLLALAGPSGVQPAHAARLRALAATGAPLAAGLSLDLEARRRLAARDTAGARSQWELATQRYEVLSVPSGLVASLWPIRLAELRVAVARGDSTVAESLCGTFAELIGYTDQAAWPQVMRLCRKSGS
jgi:protein kinase-like protein